MDILNNYLDQIKDYKKLKYNELKELLNSSKKDKSKEKEIFNEVFNGSIYYVLKDIKISKYELLKSGSYDLGDIINSALEVWYKKIISYELLKHDSYTKALDIKYSHNVVRNVITSKTELDNLCPYQKQFDELLNSYICIRNEINDIPSDFKMVEVLENIYLSLSNNDKNIVKINARSIRKLRKLLAENGMYEKISNDYSYNFEDEVLNDTSNDIDILLSVLSKRNQEIMKLRYGFVDDYRYKLLEIANMYGMSMERVRQIEEESIEKIKNSPKVLKKVL